MADQYAHAAARVSVAALAEAAGFESIRSSSSSVMAEVMLRYMEEIGAGAHATAELAGRADPNAVDVLLSIQDLGVSLAELNVYARASEEVSFPLPIADFPVTRAAKGFSSFSDKDEEPPRHIPAFLPAFPDAHTYMATPSGPPGGAAALAGEEPEAARAARAARAAEEQREAESALVRMAARAAPADQVLAGAASAGEGDGREGEGVAGGPGSGGAAGGRAGGPGGEGADGPREGPDRQAEGSSVAVAPDAGGERPPPSLPFLTTPQWAGSDFRLAILPPEEEGEERGAAGGGGGEAPGSQPTASALPPLPPIDPARAEAAMRAAAPLFEGDAWGGGGGSGPASIDVDPSDAFDEVPAEPGVSKTGRVSKRTARATEGAGGAYDPIRARAEEILSAAVTGSELGAPPTAIDEDDVERV